MSKTLKTIIIIAATIVLVAGGLLGYKYVKTLIDENNLLKIQRARLERLVEISEQEREDAFEIIDSLNLISEKLERESNIKSIQIEVLKDSLENIPEFVEEITPDASYDSLQNRYPDPINKKEYKFTQTQVKDIHVDVLFLDLFKDINSRLTDSNAILKMQVETFESKEFEYKKIISNYEEENQALKDYLDRANANTLKVRTQRNVLLGVSGASLAIFAILIAL